MWEGVNPGIYNTWDECKAQIQGYPNAKYRSYPSLEAANAAYATPYQVESKQSGKKPILSEWELKKIIVPKSISVDAACSGNPGLLEYRGVVTTTKEELFKMGPFQHGTNNIGEFLALVHGLAYLYKANDDDTIIYSDSKTAMAWVRNEKVKSSLKRVAQNEVLFALVDRALLWLQSHNYQTKVVKWKTEEWGEIPADFGRK